MNTVLDGAKAYFEDLKNGCNNLIDCKDLYKSISAKEKYDMFIN